MAKQKENPIRILHEGTRQSVTINYDQRHVL